MTMSEEERPEGTSRAGNCPAEPDIHSISTRWHGALKEYYGVTGLDPEHKFDTTGAIINWGLNEVGHLSKTHRKEQKDRKLRTLFTTSVELITTAAQPLNKTDIGVLHPSLTLSAAVAFMLIGLRANWDDYDAFVVFFEDISALLQRTATIASRLPVGKNCEEPLMEVFGDLTRICGNAQRNTELGNFRQWMKSSFDDDQKESIGALRAKIETNLEHLEATAKSAVHQDPKKFQELERELEKNHQDHKGLVEKQKDWSSSEPKGDTTILNEVQDLIEACNKHRQQRGLETRRVVVDTGERSPSANRIREKLPQVESEANEYLVLKETRVSGTCDWIFFESQWKEWIEQSETPETPPVLALAGEPGVGKSHLAAAIFDELWTKASKSPEHYACAQFYFREQHQNLSTFLQGLTSMVNQVAEQSDALGKMIEDELFNGETLDTQYWNQLVERTLSPCFPKGGSRCLYVILDGIDEMDDTETVAQFVESVQQQQLRIAIVLTGPQHVLSKASDLSSLVTLEVANGKQLQDMRSIIWSRLNSLPSAQLYSRYAKQRIASKVEEVSPNMLYAEHLLARFNSLKREAAVMRSLKKPMPKGLFDLYEDLLESCLRSSSSKRQELIKLLLHLVAYSYRPLSLSQIISWLQQMTGDEYFDTEDIPEIFEFFLRIGDPGTDSEMNNPLPTDGTSSVEPSGTEDSMSASSEQALDDGWLSIKFHERHMRAFFRDKSRSGGDFHMSPSEAHRQIFLTSAKFAWPTLVDEVHPGTSYQTYATEHVFHHWTAIDPENHSVEERVEVYETLCNLIRRHEFAELMELTSTDYSDSVNDDFFTQVKQWADILSKAESGKLSKEARGWWTHLIQDSRRVLLPLARAHLRRVYRSNAKEYALVSFKTLRDCLDVSGLASFLSEEGKQNFPSVVQEEPEGAIPDKIAVLGVPSLFADVKMSAQAYRASADLLVHFEQNGPAEQMCQMSLETWEKENSGSDADIEERVKAQVLMAQMLLERGQSDEAKEFVELFQKDLSNSNISPWVKRRALLTKASTEISVGETVGARESFAEAREADPTSLTDGDILVNELKQFHGKGEHELYIATLKQYTPLERLTWLTWNYVEEGDDRHTELLNITAATQEATFVTRMYEEAIQYLDNVGAGAPMRIRLAILHMVVTEDFQMARQVLDDVLDSTCSGCAYNITYEAPEYTLVRALMLQIDVLFELFRNSSDPILKEELLTSAKCLMSRPLASELPVIFDTTVTYYRLNVARMHLKMGPAIDFQSLLQGEIDRCIEALTDTVGWNDISSLVLLAKALYILSTAVESSDELRKASDILSSARFSPVTSAGSENDKPASEGTSQPASPQSDTADPDRSTQEDGHPANPAVNGIPIKESTIKEYTEDGSTEDASEYETAPESNGESSYLPIIKGANPNDIEGVGLECEGHWDPANTSRGWGGRVAYRCYTCDSILCEECYERRMAEDRGERPIEGRKFCGKNHELVKLPVEGWKGMSGGKIMIEGEPDLDFQEYLSWIRDDLLKRAWDEFWAGA